MAGTSKTDLGCQGEGAITARTSHKVTTPYAALRVDGKAVRTLACAVVEQGGAAAIPLAVWLLAARTLPVAEHGTLALMAGGLAAGLAVQAALVLDPLTARGRVRPATVGAVAGLVAVVAVLTLLVALPLRDGLAGAIAWGMAGAAGPVLLMMARRVAHLRQRPRDALGAVLVAAVLTAGLAVPAETSGEFLMAAALGPAAGGALALALSGFLRRPGRKVLVAVARHHARLGGWLLVSAGPWVVATQAPLVILAAQHGEAAAGVLRGLMLLVVPMAHVSAAVGGVVQPRLADAARLRDVRRAALWWGGVIGLLGTPWALALAAAPGGVAGTVLGADYAGPAGSVLPLLAAAAVLGAFGAGPALALRAARRGRAVAAAAGTGAVVGLGAAAALVPVFGIAGAALALLAARLADIAVQLGALRCGGDATRREAWA